MQSMFGSWKTGNQPVFAEKLHFRVMIFGCYIKMQEWGCCSTKYLSASRGLFQRFGFFCTDIFNAPALNAGIAKYF